MVKYAPIALKIGVHSPSGPNFPVAFISFDQKNIWVALMYRSIGLQLFTLFQLGLLSPTSGVGQMSTGGLMHQQAQHHPQTPTTPVAAAAPGQRQTPFLPGFLMGDYTQQVLRCLIDTT